MEGCYQTTGGIKKGSWGVKYKNIPQVEKHNPALNVSCLSFVQHPVAGQ